MNIHQRPGTLRALAILAIVALSTRIEGLDLRGTQETPRAPAAPVTANVTVQHGTTAATTPTPGTQEAPPPVKPTPPPNPPNPLVPGPANPLAAPPAPPPPPPEPIVLTPLQFVPALPSDPVAWVNGVAIPASAILEVVLEQNFSTGVTALVMGKILDIELKRAKVELTDADINDELTEIINGLAPGKTAEEVEKSGQTSMKHLRSQARTNRGWKKLFWDAQKIPEDQRNNQTQQLMMQFFIRQIMERYDRRIRGTNPQPKVPGIVAEIVEKETGNEIRIGASESLDFLIGLVKLSGLVDARGELVDRAVLDQVLKKQDAVVSEEDVANWAAKMRAKHTPPFTWEQISRIKGTSVEREMERWRRIQAWKKATKAAPPEAEVEKFLNEHKSFFVGKTKKVSHILFRTTDEVTGLPLPDSKQKSAEETAKLMHSKIVEGVDFGWAAKHYSEDSVTAKGDGRLAQALKEWGGGLDKEFLSTAWKLENVNDIAPPVKSAYGWHIIKLDEVTNPQNKQEPNWKDERYWEWVTDEFETQQMEAYIGGLKKAATIKLAPDEVLFGLKNREYFPAAK